VEELTVDVLDALDLDRAHLVGPSFGGFSALRSAAAYPDRVARIVLLGCPAFVPGWTAPAFFKLLRTPLLGAALVALPPTAGIVRMSLRQMGHQASLRAAKIPQPMLDWIRSRQRDTDTLRNDAAMIVRCGTWRRGFDPSLDLTGEALGSVQAPTLVVVGTDDPVGSEDVARGLAGHVPQADVEIWPNAGHLPWLDDPDRAAKLTSSFLTSTER
jgi:pimeloyl-ACP methyl ester carboxylesterase